MIVPVPRKYFGLSYTSSSSASIAPTTITVSAKSVVQELQHDLDRLRRGRCCGKRVILLIGGVAVQDPQQDFLNLKFARYNNKQKTAYIFNILPYKSSLRSFL